MPKCPRCGGEMVLRKGKYGKFWGCKSYPKCKGTRQFRIQLTEDACQSGELQCWHCPYKGTDRCFILKNI